MAQGHSGAHLGALPVPQLHLPIFPDGVTHITANLAFEKKDGRVTYFNGFMPVFTHDEKDIRTFRMITSQFCCSGYVREVDIVRAFGVPAISVKRAVKLYREKGVGGFYEKRASRGPAVLTPPVMQKAQELLDDGMAVADVAAALGLKKDTLQKAVRAGRLRALKKKTNSRTRPPS